VRQSATVYNHAHEAETTRTLDAGAWQLDALWAVGGGIFHWLFEAYKGELQRTASLMRLEDQLRALGHIQCYHIARSSVVAVPTAAVTLRIHAEHAALYVREADIEIRGRQPRSCLLTHIWRASDNPAASDDAPIDESRFPLERRIVLQVQHTPDGGRSWTVGLGSDWARIEYTGPIVAHAEETFVLRLRPNGVVFALAPSGALSLAGCGIGQPLDYGMAERARLAMRLFRVPLRVWALELGFAMTALAGAASAQQLDGHFDSLALFRNTLHQNAPARTLLSAHLPRDDESDLTMSGDWVPAEFRHIPGFAPDVSLHDRDGMLGASQPITTTATFLVDQERQEITGQLPNGRPIYFLPFLGDGALRRVLLLADLDNFACLQRRQQERRAPSASSSPTVPMRMLPSLGLPRSLEIVGVRFEHPGRVVGALRDAVGRAHSERETIQALAQVFGTDPSLETMPLAIPLTFFSLLTTSAPGSPMQLDQA